MSKASERQKRYRESQAENGKKQVSVMLSSDTVKALERLQSQLGLGSKSEVIEQIVTSDADKFTQLTELERKIEERVLFHVHNEGSYRKAAKKLNEEGIPSSLGQSSWGHSRVSIFMHNIGTKES